MKVMIRKLARKRGFTLAETLIAVLILLMVTGIVGGAIPAASNAFIKVVDAANAQVLLSTAKTVLRDELSTAAEVSKIDDEEDDSRIVIQYRSSNNGWSRIVYTNTGTDAGIVVQNGKYVDAETKEIKFRSERPLVSDKAITENLALEIDGVSVVDGLITMDLKVGKKKPDGTLTTVAEEDGFAIRSVG